MGLHSNQALLPSTLLKNRTALARAIEARARKARNIKPKHTLVDQFYEQFSRKHLMPITNQQQHDGWECLTLKVIMNSPMKLPSYPVTITVDMPPELADETIPADLPWTPPDFTKLDDANIIECVETWPDYPRLYLSRPKAARGNLGVGWLIADDNPKGGGLRVKQPGKDDNIVYNNTAELLRYGWTVRRDLHI